MLTCLPRLRLLDGAEVGALQRGPMRHVLGQQEAYLALMLRNACMAHKMVRACVCV